MSSWNNAIVNIAVTIKELEKSNLQLESDKDQLIALIEIKDKHIAELKKANKDLKFELIWNERE